MQPPWFTWANLLTLSRTFLIAPFVWCITQQRWLLAAACFVLAVVSDVYDGKLARRFRQVSNIGGVLDHGTDALFVTAGAWALAQADMVNIYIVWLIPAAFVQYLADSKALAGHTLRTSTLGRINGVAYYVMVGVGVGLQVLGWYWLLQPLMVFAWLLVISTTLSMLDRGMTYWRHHGS